MRKKAEAGQVVHQGALGWCYLYGINTEVNHAEAFRWLSLAAHEGRASRPFVNLARMYAEGLGTPRDLAEAFRHYYAVRKVEVRAQLELARMYARGEGVTADPDEALKWYSLVAAEQQSIDDVAIAAFAGAVTSSEIQEAKDYVASRR